jgi:hypothetical protein
VKKQDLEQKNENNKRPAEKEKTNVAIHILLGNRPEEAPIKR